MILSIPTLRLSSEKNLMTECLTTSWIWFLKLERTRRTDSSHWKANFHLSPTPKVLRRNFFNGTKALLKSLKVKSWQLASNGLQLPKLLQLAIYPLSKKKRSSKSKQSETQATLLRTTDSHVTVWKRQNNNSRTFTTVSRIRATPWVSLTRIT